LLPTFWRLLYGGKARRCQVFSICPPLTANACYQLGVLLVCQWFENIFNSVITFSLSLKDLVFLVSAKSAVENRQALWQVLVSAMAGAT